MEPSRPGWASKGMEHSRPRLWPLAFPRRGRLGSIQADYAATATLGPNFLASRMASEHIPTTW